MVERIDPNTTRYVVRYFAIVLLGPLVLLVAWGALKIGLEHRCASGSDAGYQGFTTGPAPDVLFIGSSHTRQSYDIAAVEAATGRTAYALAYGALDQNEINLLLQELLPDPARRPKIVVLEAYSALLARKPELDDPRLFFDLPPDLKLKFLANYWQLHPQVSAILDLFDLIVNCGTEQILTYPLNRSVLAGFSYKGSYRGKVVPGVSESEFRLFHAKIAGSQPDPAQFTALRQIIAVCKRYGVRLLVAESPMPTLISSKSEIQTLKNVFRTICYENSLPYFDGDEGFPMSDPAYFADASHLSTAGRSLYTSNMVAHFGPLLIQDKRITSGHGPGSSVHGLGSAQEQSRLWSFGR